MKITKRYVNVKDGKEVKQKEKTHYCPILDKQIDMSDCLEIGAIASGEMEDLGGRKNGDYSKMYELDNYDEICKFDCRELNLPLEKRRKCFFKNKKDYLKWKNSK